MSLYLYPTFSSKNYLVNKIVMSEFATIIPVYAKGRLIDIGCGNKPLNHFLSQYVTEHIGVDHEGTLHDKSKIDLFGTAYNIPVDDGYFDTALCTAVLEHLEEPSDAIKETHRVLKTGGYAIYTVPFFWHLHEEPRDFYRYTKYGLKYLFEKNGTCLLSLALSSRWKVKSTLVDNSNHRSSYSRGFLFIG